MRTLITGASRGIGAAIAEELANAGHDLILLGRDDKRLGKLGQRLCDSYGVSVDTMSVDLTEEGAAKQIAKEIGKERINHLVLNAGIFREGNLADDSYPSFCEQIEVNLQAIWELTYALLPKLEKKGARRIVVTGSTAGLEPSSTAPSYSVTKWAVRGYAQNLRKELMKRKIGVTHLAPGGTFTDMWKADPEAKNLTANDKRMQKRLMKPEDVAVMVRAALSLSEQANVEEVVMRPMLWDLHV